MTRPCPRVLVLDRLGPDLGSQVDLTAIIALLGAAAEARGVDLAIDQARLEELPLRESTVATINESYDLVLVTGEDLLCHDPVTESGWGLDIPADLLDAIAPPLAILAAGYDAPAFAPDRLYEARGHLRRTFDRAVTFSVRDPGAAARFEARVGVAPIVSGPLGCAVEPVEHALCGLDPSRRPIGVSLQLDRAKDVLPFPFDSRFEALVRALMQTLEELVTEDGRQVVFLPHTLNAVDHELARLLRVRLPEGSVVFAHEAVPGLFAPTEIQRAGTLSALYAAMDVVLAHRPASVVAPFTVGTPTVALTATDGASFLLDSLGAPAHSVIDLRQFEREIRVPRLLGAIRAARREEAAASRDARLGGFRDSLGAITAQILDRAIARHAHPAPPMERASSF